MDGKKPVPEFSRPIATEQVAPSGRAIKEQASLAECNALTERFDLIHVDNFAVTGNITPDGARCYTINVLICADYSGGKLCAQWNAPPKLRGGQYGRLGAPGARPERGRGRAEGICRGSRMTSGPRGYHFSTWGRRSNS